MVDDKWFSLFSFCFLTGLLVSNLTMTLSETKRGFNFYAGIVLVLICVIGMGAHLGNFVSAIIK